MNRKIITGCAIVAACTALAMPTKKELNAARELVADVIGPDLRAYKAGEKSAADFAEAQRALAAKTADEAQRYLLLQSAFKVYAHAEEYEKAADVLAQIRRDIPDVPPNVIVEVVSKAMGRVAGRRAPRMFRMFKCAKTQVRSGRELAEIEKDLKVRPRDMKLNERLGVCKATLGDWPAACEAFLKAGGAVAKTVRAERGAKPDWAALADFWWNYNRPEEDDDRRDPTPFQLHAGELYRRAIWDGVVSDDVVGTRIRQRAKETESVDVDVRPPLATGNGDRYCIIDLAGGARATSYPVSYAAGEPIGGWSDVYKTTKLALRKVEAGKYRIGDLEKNVGKQAVDVEFSKPYYIGVFPVTQKQWELVMGDRPSMFTNALTWARRPLESISYQNIRGAKKGMLWPMSNEVDDDSFLGQLRKKCGLGFELPTEAQWEVACRAGTTGRYCLGKKKAGIWKTHWRHRGNGGYDYKKWGPWWGEPWNVIWGKDRGSEFGTAVVGSYPANDWGFYDMIGNIGEWCADRYSDKICGGVDPTGVLISSVANGRSVRKQAWLSGVEGTGPSWNASFDRAGCWANWHYSGTIGFRVCLPLAAFVPAKIPYVPAEKQAKFDLKQKPLTEHKLALTEDIGMDFQFCPAGTFKMGYVDAPAIAPLRDVTITRPFWITKGFVTGHQMAMVSGTDFGTGALHLDTRQQADEYVAQFQKKYGSLLPKGYVFRLPTEAEWEYVAKSGAKEAKGELFNWKHDYRKNPLKNEWGVAGMCVPSKHVMFDKIPWSDGKGAVKIDVPGNKAVMDELDYSKASNRDPYAWSDDAQARTFRRNICCKEGEMNLKISCLNVKDRDSLWGATFHLVIAPDPATLNKFEMK